jgi:hypothetical protein
MLVQLRFPTRESETNDRYDPAPGFPVSVSDSGREDASSSIRLRKGYS